VIVNPSAGKNEDYGTASVTKHKSVPVKVENRHGEDTIADSMGHVPKSAINNEDLGKNNSEADF
jgi:hypothetical protein